MRRFSLVSLAVLAAITLTQAQGFDDYDYTSPTTTTETTTSYAASSSTMEKKFSLYLAVGAGFSLGGEYVGPSLELVEQNGPPANNIVEIDDEYLNLGRGLKIDLGATYRFLEHVDVVAGLNLSLGVPYTSVEQTYTDNTITPSFSSSLIEDYKHTQVGLKVLLQPRFKAFDLFDVYIGGGLGLYFTSVSIEREYSSAGVRYTETVDVDVKAALPFIGRIGAEYPIADRLVIFLDGMYEAMNVTLQKVSLDGTSTFPGTGTDQGGLDRDPTTVETFEKDATDRNAPTKYPASNIAIRLGVRIPLF